MTDNKKEGMGELDRFLEKFLPGESEGVQRLRSQIATLNAPSNKYVIRNVLIWGESGSGKNYVAQVIAGHRHWLLVRNTDSADDKAEKPLNTYTNKFAEISLPGLPDTLVESELFGHERGAFTGADRKHDGYFREDYTDILLDEIGDASAALQAKLLRVLNSGQFRPVGGKKDQEADARLLLATNRDLLDMVGRGMFREDLLWRAREFVIDVPPLRTQLDGLPAIAENILADLCEKKPAGISSHPALSEYDFKFACSYGWPGNIRQLRLALARWIMYGGRYSLDAIVSAIEKDLQSHRKVTEGNSTIEYEVRSALEVARTSGQAAGSTLDKFVRLFSGRAKMAVFDWVSETRPTSQELIAMFPDHKDSNSIRTQIRKWGGQ